MSPKSLAEIHDDLLGYLNDDECVDPIGYLETVQLELQTAIAALDTAELARAAAPTSPSEPVPSTPRVLGSTERPEGIRADILELRGHEITKHVGGRICYVLTGVTIPAGLRVGGFTFDPESGSLSWSQDSRGSFVTEVEETTDAD